MLTLPLAGDLPTGACIRARDHGEKVFEFLGLILLVHVRGNVSQCITADHCLRLSSVAFAIIMEGSFVRKDISSTLSVEESVQRLALACYGLTILEFVARKLIPQGLCIERSWPHKSFRCVIGLQILVVSVIWAEFEVFYLFSLLPVQMRVFPLEQFR